MTAPLSGGGSLPRLYLIWAQAQDRVIGRDNTLPWHLPEDLAHFKQKTAGRPVIMGRRTWDSLPPRFRPLPGRKNIVVTRQPDWQAGGAVRAGSLPDAMALCAGEEEAWVIGGAQLYAQALPLAHGAEVTEIGAHFEGDTFAPALDFSWHEVARQAHTSAGGLDYSFVTYLNTRR